MRYLEDLKDMLCKELEELAMKGELSAGDLETIHKLTASIKNIDKIEMFKDVEGYSGNRGYDDGNSYANRGKHYVRGHYSRDDGRSYDMRRDFRYSRDDGKHHMIERLEEMMDQADSEKEREAIRHCISKLENI